MFLKNGRFICGGAQLEARSEQGAPGRFRLGRPVFAAGSRQVQPHLHPSHFIDAIQKTGEIIRGMLEFFDFRKPTDVFKIFLEFGFYRRYSTGF